jgi:pimeloyl-ACP methyl ester carboxylesterase
MTGRAAPCDFVLIHGAWHGGWCWDAVRARLEAAAHRVHAPTLPGLAERATELTGALGLADHIASVVAFVEAADLNDIVLVGHSYGGMVITGAADALAARIAQLVYVDAAVPRDGDSMVTYGAPRPPEVIAASIAALRALAPDGIAMLPPPPEALGVAPDHPACALLRERMTPHPLKTWLDPIRLPTGAAHALPRTYLHCTNPVLEHSQFPHVAGLAAQDPAWRYGEIATGHEAMLTAPDEVARHLLDTLAHLRHLSGGRARPHPLPQEPA